MYSISTLLCESNFRGLQLSQVCTAVRVTDKAGHTSTVCITEFIGLLGLDLKGHGHRHLSLDQAAPSHKIYIYILYTCMDRQKYRYAYIRISPHTSKN